MKQYNNLEVNSKRQRRAQKASKSIFRRKELFHVLDTFFIANRKCKQHIKLHLRGIQGTSYGKT